MSFPKAFCYVFTTTIIPHTLLVLVVFFLSFFSFFFFFALGSNCLSALHISLISRAQTCSALRSFRF